MRKKRNNNIKDANTVN